MGEHARQLKGALLGIYAQTSLHAGSGTALGVVDLPIQRERHTQWPLVPGSSLKGILRDACREKIRGQNGGDRKTANDDSILIAAFGPAKIEAGADTGWAGALSVTDARILAFPVRSLKGVFAWVTCPGVLERLNRDVALADTKTITPVATPAVGDGHFLAPVGCACVDNNRIVLEEFDFTRTQGDDATKVAGLSQALAHFLPDGAAFEGAFQQTRERFQKHLVILSDNDFTHFVRHATEVSARIALDYNTKTVKGTALFYQESLPPETLMYAVLLADDSRGGAAKPAGDILSFVQTRMPSILQIGGDETTGKGLCAVRCVT